MVESDSNEEFIIQRHKIVFVGDAGVGKTSIITRLIDNPFNDCYEPSIGVEFMSKEIKYHDKSIKLQLWDTAGQEKYKGLIPSYVRNSSLVFLVYDISSKASFENIPNWLSFIRSIEKNTSLVLCGNKLDEEREVNKEEGQALAKKESIPFFEVSAKTNENIKNMFYCALAELPIFSENNTNKENLIKELMRENEDEKIPEEIKFGAVEIEAKAENAVKDDDQEKKVDSITQNNKEEDNGNNSGIDNIFNIENNGKDSKEMINDLINQNNEIKLNENIMVDPNSKCHSKGHEEIIPNYYCPQCKIYICKKCEISHSNLFYKKKHILINLDKD